MSKKILPALVVLLVAGMAAPALAGTKEDLRDLQEKVQRLEQSASGQSDALVRISELESQIQQMTGQIEQLSYALDQANSRLDAISSVLSGDAGSGDMMHGATGMGDDFAASRGPVNLAAGDPVAQQITKSTDAAASVQLPADPDAAFEYASGFLLSGDYQHAKAAFEAYVEKFPNHPRTSEAKFRLGEVYLTLKENAAAADVFIDHIKSYPNDPRAAEAYLKLGTAFSRLDKSKEACTVFKALKAKFPNASRPVSQRVDLEMSRIHCQ